MQLKGRLKMVSMWFMDKAESIGRWLMTLLVLILTDVLKIVLKKWIAKIFEDLFGGPPV